MIWKDEQYRTVMYCGDVDIGAVYPPRRGRGLWRWRIWINRTGHQHEGRCRGEHAARAAVEGRFHDFLRAASLEQTGGEA